MAIPVTMYGTRWRLTGGGKLHGGRRRRKRQGAARRLVAGTVQYRAVQGITVWYSPAQYTVQ